MTAQTTTAQPVKLSNSCWAVPSNSNPGTEHYVEIVNDGEHADYSCTCKGYEYRGHCRHIDMVDIARNRAQDERPCTARPNTELGLYLISGGNLGRAS